MKVHSHGAATAAATATLTIGFHCNSWTHSHCCGKVMQLNDNKEASKLYAALLLMSSRSMQMLSLMSSRSMLIIGTSSLTCGWHADDMQLLPGVVLFKIRELKQVKSQRNQTNH